MKSTRLLTVTAVVLIGALAFTLPMKLAASSCCSPHAIGAETNPHAAHGHETKVSADILSAEVMESYFAIQTALAADSLDGVSKHAKKLYAASDLESAKKIAEATNLSTARKSFAQLSTNLIKVARKQDTAPDGVKLAHCPMAFGNKGAPWLQSAETPLANPYFGAEMLRCGEFQELFSGRDIILHPGD